MSSDSDLISLYSGRILELASDIPHVGKLSEPMVSAKKRAPLCGSTVSVDLVVQDGRIADYAQDVKACALGQASASVVGAHILGLSRAEVARARDELKAMLKENGPTPSAPFQDLEVLRPARDYKNRHDSILLALETTLDAFDKLDNSACA